MKREETSNELIFKEKFTEKELSRLKRISESTTELKKVMELKELLQHLEELNLSFKNEDDISAILIEKGYFKFSGYRKIFLTTFNDNTWIGKYEDNVTDKNVMDIMELDTDLSKLFFEYISLIEMKIKARAAYFISKEYGCDAHLKKETFSTEEKWEAFMIDRYFKTLDKEKKNEDPIVMHHISNYDSKLPIWALFDKISFDAFLFFMQNLNEEVKSKTFKDIFCSNKTYYNLYDFGHINVYPHYLTIIKFMRNRVCHHDRIIDYRHTYMPKGNRFKRTFINKFESNQEGVLYLTDIVNLMGCFLNKEDFKSFRRKYKERINQTKNKLPIKYRKRLFEELGIKNVNI